jgi:hypothetical protein
MKIKNPHPQTSAKIKQKIVEIDKMNTRNTYVRPLDFDYNVTINIYDVLVHYLTLSVTTIVSLS